MVIEPHMKQGRQHKLISTIFLATSVTKKLDHNTVSTDYDADEFERVKDMFEEEYTNRLQIEDEPTRQKERP